MNLLYSTILNSKITFEKKRLRNPQNPQKVLPQSSLRAHDVKYG